MSEKEADKVVVDELDNEGSDAGAASALAREVGNQLQDFEGGKKITISDSSALSSVLENVSIGLSDKEKTKAVGQLGENLTSMVTGELTHLRDMMVRNGITDTKEVDAKIKAAKAEVEAVKPLHDAVLKGDIQSLQKLVGTLKPEQLSQYAELLQKHFDRQGLGIELDAVDGKLIVSRSHGDRAVAISKDKTDVIGINKDGSYDFGRHYRRENAGKELQGMTDSALNNYLYPRYYQKQIYDNTNSSLKSLINHSIGHAISNPANLSNEIRQTKGR